MGPIWPCFIDLIDLTDPIGPIDPRNLTDLIDLTDRPHFHLQCMCFGAHSGTGQFKDLRDFVGLIDLIVTLLLAQLVVTSDSPLCRPAPLRGWVRSPVGAQKTHVEPPWACLLDSIHLIDLTDLTDLSELKDLIDLFGLKDLTELIMLTSWSYFRNEPEWLLGDSHSALSAVGRNVGLPLMSPSSSEGVGSIPGGRTKDTRRATLGLPV